MINPRYTTICNNQAIPLKEIPEHFYNEFFIINIDLLKDNIARHCVNYFAYKIDDKLKLICCIADDETHQIFVSSSLINADENFPSLTAQNHIFEKFERELHENFGIKYIDHPWLKPLRYPHNRIQQDNKIENYPFYQIESEELHEVGVGPIHAGIIEPGHFRFICNGEQIMHLEIQLGYQHRGIEQLFLEKSKLIEYTTLAESIAGDNVIGHTTAFANLWESLSNFDAPLSLHYSRMLALELERIATHTGDLAAICGDIAYQLGNAVYGRLRTPIINFLQEWCGNRLGRGVIRAGKINYPFTPQLANRLKQILDAYETDFDEITEKLFTLPSALSRMEKTGVVSVEEAIEIGSVGMAARASGLMRDIRLSHPHNLYKAFTHIPITKNHGDVYSRAQIRREEIKQSISYINELLSNIPDNHIQNTTTLKPKEYTFALSLVEGWRGEICHCAITGNEGNMLIYKIKDPSFHNWMTLAQAVRNNEISDFPICNKSFNLSYCGHDL